MRVDAILFLITIFGAPLIVPLLIGAYLEGKGRVLNAKNMLLSSGIGYSAEGVVFGLIGWPLLAIVSSIIFCGLTHTLALVGTTSKARLSKRK